MTKCRLLILLFFLLSISLSRSLYGLEALIDPIPQKIPKGPIVVEAKKFVRLPQTVDSSNEMTNAAHARIQYMVPFGDAVGELVINDTRGLLYLTDDKGSEPQVFLDLREEDVGFYDAAFPNEMGVAGIAFHPDFRSVGKPGFGKFYTAYSASSASGIADYLEEDSESHESVIREWTVFDPRAKKFRGTSREVFRVGQFAPNHNIGKIGFNPVAEIGSLDYGVLYASLGDGGAANDPKGYGQAINEPQSSIIRIDPLNPEKGRGYGVPPDNPFVDEAETADVAPEVWVYGLRHAQHFSWDSRGRMFLSDIGQNQIEEVNLGVAGANYGWRLREGTFATAFDVTGGEVGQVYPRPSEDTGYTYPIAQYDHDEGNAIGGGFVYEGDAVPQLRGKFVFCDLVRGRVFYIETKDLQSGRLQKISELRLSFDGVERELSSVTTMDDSYSSGQRVDLRLSMDALGELYMLTKSDGWIRKIVPVSQ